MTLNFGEQNKSLAELPIPPELQEEGISSFAQPHYFHGGTYDQCNYEPDVE